MTLLDIIGAGAARRSIAATLDTKALEAAAKAVNDAIDTHGEFAIESIATAAIEAYLSATPSRNDILEEAAAFKAGQAETEARIADLLKDPAAVRVNYLRGGIACQNLINEALEEAARVAEDAVDTTDDGIDAFDASQIIAAAIRALVKP